MKVKSYLKAVPTYRKLLAGVVVACVLSACGVEGVPLDENGEVPALGEAIPEEGVSEFTALVLLNGSVQLMWPEKQGATGYYVLQDNKAIAKLDASQQFVVIPATGNETQMPTFSIIALDSAGKFQRWGQWPVVLYQQEGSEPEPPVGAANPDESEQPTEPQIPAENEQPTETENPAENEQPTETENPTENEQPTETENSTENEQPTETESPTENEQPTETENPTENEPNLAPVITDTSYNCDPAIESVSYNIGESDTFTLDVTDESPSTLTYSFDSSSERTIRLSVDANGVFSVTALQAGESYLWLSVSDEDGLVDEYELQAIVK